MDLTTWVQIGLLFLKVDSKVAILNEQLKCNNFLLITFLVEISNTICTLRMIMELVGSPNGTISKF